MLKKILTAFTKLDAIEKRQAEILRQIEANVKSMEYLASEIDKLWARVTSDAAEVQGLIDERVGDLEIKTEDRLERLTSYLNYLSGTMSGLEVYYDAKLDDIETSFQAVHAKEKAND